MHFVKIGTQYINLDQVTHIAPNPMNPNDLKLHFAAGFDFEGEPYQYGLSLYGDDAEALRRYLATISTDLHGPEQADAAFLTYRARGGTLSYTIWQEHTQLLASYHEKSERWWADPANVKRVTDLELDLKY